MLSTIPAYYLPINRHTPAAIATRAIKTTITGLLATGSSVVIAHAKSHIAKRMIPMFDVRCMRLSFPAWGS
jgi:hypothetical protein